jgi:hypothetical protein
LKHDESSLSSAISGLSTAGTEKFRIAKELVSLSEQEPKRLYPFFDQMAELLDAENNIIKWTAFQIMANLAAVDRPRRIDAIIERYLAPIAGPVMITAGHAIQGSAKIARSHPHLVDRIVPAILGVEQARYKTEECRNIAIGHAITALESFGPAVRSSPEVMAFIEIHVNNSRPATRKKALRFLKGKPIEPAR